jgi:hypothetical protein
VAVQWLNQSALPILGALGFPQVRDFYIAIINIQETK